jgi:gluconolactonase
MTRRVLRPGLFLFTLALAAQDFSEIKFDYLAREVGFAEGPAWSRKGYLVFSDTVGDRLMKWVPGAVVAPLRPAAGPSGNAFDQEGRLYTCETRARRVVRTDEKGTVEVLADKWEGKRLNAPNDIVVSKSNHVYFTDPAFGDQADRRELDFYGVYHLPPKGALKLVAKPEGRPNGIALSPNGRTLYVVNSDERNVRAYDLDRSGDASNERIVIAKIPSVPGGIRSDDAGNLYVTGKDLYVYTADGKPVHTIELHHPASNCAFGEVDGQTLFITAGSEVYRARFGAKGAY